MLFFKMVLFKAKFFQNFNFKGVKVEVPDFARH